MTDLLPCPFCGCEAIALWTGFGTQADIVCEDCGCERAVQVRDVPGNKDSEWNEKTFKFDEPTIRRTNALLCEEWNTRSIPAQQTPCKDCPHPDFCREQNGCQVEECLAPAQRQPTDVDHWIAYADKLEKVLEIVAESSTDELKRMQAKDGLRLVRPALCATCGGMRRIPHETGGYGIDCPSCSVTSTPSPAQQTPDAAQMWREAADAKDKRINELEAMLERSTLGPAQTAMTAQGALEIAANIAADLGWLGKPYPVTEIAKAIRDVAKHGYWTRDPALTSTERHCQKCGIPTGGEESYVDGQIWCHPCADCSF